MKKNIRGLTLTAMLLSASTMSYAQQGTTSSIGDLPGYDEDAYFADEPTYQQQVSQIAPAQIAPASHADTYAPAQSYQQPAYTQPAAHNNWTAPAHAHQPNATQLQPVGFFDGPLMGGRFNGPSCDTYGCDGGCDSGCASSRLGLGSMFGCGSGTWMTAEALLWFPQNRDMIPLVTTNDQGTPIISDPNTRVAFGDEIEGGLSGGFRIDAGKYLSENIGIGGRFWWLGENGDDYAAASDGTVQSVGRPFFDTTIPFGAPGIGPWRDNAVLIGFAPGNITGSIAAESSLDLLGAEAYARINLGSSKTSKLELIGGYTHFRIDDTLRIHSQHLQGLNLFELRDEFEMENRFNGGQIGFEMTSSRGRWTARSLTKVHLGNMNQVATIRGQAAAGPLPAAIPIPGSEGLLSQGKTGVHERDVFAFVPEANFKLSYQFRKNVALSVGYSLLYFDNVAMVGDVIDPMADGANLFSNPPVYDAPGFRFDDSSLWVQGIDLGMVINF